MQPQSTSTTTTTTSNLYVQSSGPADAPTIVFLHGGGAGGWMWQPTVEQLSGYHCLVPDLPEHGRSRQVQPFSIEGSAALVANLIRAQAHGGQAHVVGLSEGAQVVVALLSQAPDVVRSAFISSASLRPIPGMGLLTPAVLSATYYSTVAPFKNWDAWIRLNMKYAAGVPDTYFAPFKQEFQGMSKDGWVHLMRANLAFRLPPGLQRAKLPVLVVVGSKEYTAMQQSARDLAQALPKAKAYRVSLSSVGKGASLAQEHNWALSDPTLFARSVRAWIEGQPLPPALSPLT